MDDLDQVLELLLEEAFQQYSPIKRAQRLRFRIYFLTFFNQKFIQMWLDYLEGSDRNDNCLIVRKYQYSSVILGFLIKVC